jgi:hypothetical protein
MLFYVMPMCKPLSGRVSVNAFINHVLQAHTVELFTGVFSVSSGWIALGQPAQGLTVINVETYRAGGAIKARSNAH